MLDGSNSYKMCEGQRYVSEQMGKAIWQHFVCTG
uniref:Uncharacterized protein n=1 Tax=Rhizophora mucronata TaxID=61149 RepID=A0A2P2N999_RHIMU